MGAAEPDEEEALERSGPHESLEHAVTARVSFEADGDVARANARGPLSARCTRGTLPAVRELDHDPAWRQMGECPVRRAAIRAVPVADGRGPAGRLNASTRRDPCARMRRPGADVPAGCVSKVRWRDDEEEREDPEHASSTIRAGSEVRDGRCRGRLPLDLDAREPLEPAR